MLNQFAAAVQEAGEGPAIVAAGRSLSYAALDRASELVARKLADLYAGEGTLVGVMTERTVEIAVAYMAILKAGAAFMQRCAAFVWSGRRLPAHRSFY